ncbi:MAG: DUF4339 domain-containing protein, partial [Candidatus Hydrogenedentes bacterium]|nr:DUF4339 domain-containing protein [Candidatus Hydrogenedentota bacterium]
MARASEESAAQGLAEAESWEMDGEFLVAGRSENQTSSDSVIQVLPLLAEGEADAPGLALKEARKYSPDLDSELDAALSGPGADHTDTPAESPPPSPASSREAPQWYYLLKDERCGPVTTYRLRQLLHGGKVNRSVSVWREGMDKWQPIDALEELAVELDSAGGVSANDEISSLQRTRKLSRDCSSLLWMFVTAVCLMLLLCVTKQTFADLGKKPFLLAN